MKDGLQIAIHRPIVTRMFPPIIPLCLCATMYSVQEENRILSSEGDIVLAEYSHPINGATQLFNLAL